MNTSLASATQKRLRTAWATNQSRQAYNYRRQIIERDCGVAGQRLIGPEARKRHRAGLGIRGQREYDELFRKHLRHSPYCKPIDPQRQEHQNHSSEPETSESLWAWRRDVAATGPFYGEMYAAIDIARYSP